MHTALEGLASDLKTIRERLRNTTVFDPFERKLMAHIIATDANERLVEGWTEGAEQLLATADQAIQEANARADRAEAVLAALRGALASQDEGDGGDEDDDDDEDSASA